MSYCFAPAVPSVEVVGRPERYAVRRIWCLGRNYAEHVREMGFAAKDTQVFFSKPADAVVPGGGEVPYPSMTDNLHHEIELVVAIGKAGTDIPAGRAAEFVFGCAAGIDLTRRDLQATLRKEGRPWELAMAFDHSAPISAIRPGPAPEGGTIWLAVNGLDRQRGNLANMLWTVPEIIAALSAYVALAPGDLIFTGTPEGVGPLQRGDRVTGGIEGVGELGITLV